MYTLRTSDQVAHLPREALAGSWTFGPEGRGAIYYLIQERDRLVDLLDVLWAG